jgi:hypothetical protein
MSEGILRYVRCVIWHGMLTFLVTVTFFFLRDNPIIEMAMVRLAAVLEW